MQNQKGLSQAFIIILVALLTAGIVGGGVWYWQQKQVDKVNQEKLDELDKISKQPQEASKKEVKTEEKTTTKDKDKTSDWKTYKDPVNGYEAKHPEEFLEDSCEKTTVFFMINDKLLCDSDAPSSAFIISVLTLSDSSDGVTKVPSRASMDLDQLKYETKKLGSYEFKIRSGFMKNDSVFYQPKSIVREAELVKDNKMFIFTYRQRDTSYVDQSENFDLMLSTFKIN